MLWTWVIPTAIMGCAVVAYPWAARSVLEQPLGLSARLSHFFGWDCRLENRCIDQVATTIPFYGGIAYSVGAYLARVKMAALGAYAEAMSQVRMRRALLIGAASACYDLTLSWRPFVRALRRWDWIWVGGALWALALELTLVTYVFMVAISLLRRRFPASRWFFALTE